MTDHVLAGLVKRRAEFAAKAKEADTMLRQLLTDIEHLDGAIRLYEPGYRARTVIRRHERMSTLRVALAALREASAPMTLREIARHVVAANGQDAADEALVNTTIERVRTALLRQQKVGIVRSKQGCGQIVLWEVAR